MTAYKVTLSQCPNMKDYCEKEVEKFTRSRVVFMQQDPPRRWDQKFEGIAGPDHHWFISKVDALKYLQGKMCEYINKQDRLLDYVRIDSAVLSKWIAEEMTKE